MVVCVTPVAALRKLIINSYIAIVVIDIILAHNLAESIVMLKYNISPPEPCLISNISFKTNGKLNIYVMHI